MSISLFFLLFFKDDLLYPGYPEIWQVCHNLKSFLDVLKIPWHNSMANYAGMTQDLLGEILWSVL